MDTPQDPNIHTTPILSVVISMFSSIIAFISLAQLQVIMTIVASCVAVFSGGFAVRHFYYSTKETKLKIRKLEKDEGDDS